MEHGILINSEYIISTSTTGEIFVPIKVNNGMVVFNNGAQCTIDAFKNKFVLKHTNLPVNKINESLNTGGNLDDTNYLMKIFSQDNNNDALLSQYEAVQSGDYVPTVRDNQSAQITQIDNEGNKTEQQYSMNGNIIIDKTSNKQSPFLNDDSKDEESYNDQPRTLTNLNERRLDKSVLNKKTTNEISEYEKVKKSKKFKFTIDLEIELPTPQHIQVIREMYENNETDYVTYMVDKFVEETMSLNNSDIKSILVSKINNWIDPKKKVVKKVVKPNIKKQNINSTNTQSKHKLKQKPVIDVEVDINSSFYDKIDFLTIFTIESIEQLELVKQKLKQEEELGNNVKLIEHLKDLLDVYEN